MPADSQPPAADRPSRSLLPRTTEGWLLSVAGCALIAYGAYTVVSALVAKQSLSLMGMVLIGVGGMLMPYRVIGLIAGVGLIGLGVYMFIANYVTLQALVVTVLGVLAVAEQVRRGK